MITKDVTYSEVRCEEVFRFILLKSANIIKLDSIRRPKKPPTPPIIAFIIADLDSSVQTINTYLFKEKLFHLYNNKILIEIIFVENISQKVFAHNFRLSTHLHIKWYCRNTTFDLS